MNVKDLLAKFLHCGDIHVNLAIAEKEMRETQVKYISACNTNEALEDECSSLDKSVNLLTQEVNTLKNERKSLDEYLNQFLKDDEWNDAKVVQTKRLEEKRTQLLAIQSQLKSSEKKHGRQIELIEGLKGEKTSLEKEVVSLNHKVEAEKNIIEKKLDQRKNIRANLATLKNEWQKALEIFKERLKLADTDIQNLLALQREIEDYERRVKNAIEIPAE